MAPGIIRFESLDNKIFEISFQAAQVSKVMKEMFIALGITEESCDQEPVIPLPNVTGDTLEKVLQWMEHNKGEMVTQPQGAEQMVSSDGEGESSWEANFFSMDMGTLGSIGLVAHNLGIPALKDRCCKAIIDLTRKYCEDCTMAAQNLENLSPEQVDECYVKARWVQIIFTKAITTLILSLGARRSNL